MTLKQTFKTLYGVALEVGINNTVIAKGLQKLPEKTRNQLSEWLKTHKEHALKRLNSEI